MHMSVAVETYLRDARAEGRLRPNTLLCWGSWLRRATRDWNDPEVADAYTAPTLEHYRAELRERGYRPRTLKSIITALRRLGDYLVQRGHLPDNPANALRMPKMDPAYRPSVSNAELTALLAACDRLPGIRRGALARAVVHVLAFTAIRRRELLDLRVADVHLEDGAIHIRAGKGNKARTVFATPPVRLAIRVWLQYRGPTPHDWLWMLDRQRRLGENGLPALLRDLAAVAGLRDAQHITPRALRRGCATRLLRNGADLESIRAVMGHADLSSTFQYIDPDAERARQVAPLAAVVEDHRDASLWRRRVVARKRS